jgi:hypothetical protein
MNSRLLLFLFSSSFIRNWEEKSFLFFYFPKVSQWFILIHHQMDGKARGIFYFLFNSAPIQNPSEHIASHA